MAVASEYDAFISYSHKHDAALGPALKTRLERYAKPWYRMRALRIFLDATDLSASSGLTQSIVDALSSSEWLILLASSDAADSAWVEQEVQWWLDHKSPDRLLVVATSPGLAWDGPKPDLSQPGQPGVWAAGAPVPQALRAMAKEPRWEDLSKEELNSVSPTIPDDVVASVAAPIRGMKKRDLIGEHLRQRRRTMRLAGSTITVLAILTALAITAGLIADRKSVV